jgi:hypothetical protein
MSLYITNENGKRWFKLEGQGCLAFPEDAWVQVLERRIKQKDAMIELLAKSCEELSAKLCEYPEFQCPKLKSDWVREAEKAVQDADAG